MTPKIENILPTSTVRNVWRLLGGITLENLRSGLFLTSILRINLLAFYPLCGNWSLVAASLQFWSVWEEY